MEAKHAVICCQARGLLYSPEDAWAVAGNHEMETLWSIANRVALETDSSPEELCDFLGPQLSDIDCLVHPFGRVRGHSVERQVHQAPVYRQMGRAAIQKVIACTAWQSGERPPHGGRLCLPILAFVCKAQSLLFILDENLCIV